MTPKPISIPISFFALALLVAAGTAIAAPGYFEMPAPAADKAVRRDPAPCPQGEAYTCRIQCGPTTRTAFDRLVENTGVEACVVTKCRCQAVAEPVNINDPTQATALVIFGVRQLLPPAPP